MSILIIKNVNQLKNVNMSKEFNLTYWNFNNYKLKKRYPQLSNADLIWRHETKDDLFGMIADKLGIKKKELEEIVESF